MSNSTSVKIDNKWLEKLRLQYQDMSFNQIMECISSEEEYHKRSIYGYENSQEANLLIHEISVKYPGLSLKSVREMILKQMENIPLATK